MQVSKALEILGLKPDAAPGQIKEAYRDLVKVWHPDRFGTDPRLREKAQQKLAELNQAYTTLQDYDAAPQPKAPPRQQETNISSPRVWIFGIPAIPRRLWPLIGLSTIVLIAYPTLRYLAARPTDPAPATNPIPAAQPPATPSGQPPLDAPKPVSSPIAPKLSERERAAIEARCAPKKNREGAAAYVRCLEQQLGQTKKSPPIVPKQASTDNVGPSNP